MDYVQHVACADSQRRWVTFPTFGGLRCLHLQGFLLLLHTGRRPRWFPFEISANHGHWLLSSTAVITSNLTILKVQSAVTV